MSQLAFARLVVALGLLVAGGSALDAYLNLNDTFLGEICDAADVDIVEFDALQGTIIRLDVEATGTGMLSPRLVLTELATATVLADVSGGSSVSTAVLVLANPGRYEVRISSADGSVGEYELDTVGRIRPDQLKLVGTRSVLSGDTVEVAFDALAGFGVSASIAAASSGPKFANPSLEGPHGPISLSGVLTQLPDRIRIDKLPLGLTAFGSFTFRADNVGGSGDVKTHVRLRPGLPRKVVVEADDCN